MHDLLVDLARVTPARDVLVDAVVLIGKTKGPSETAAWIGLWCPEANNPHWYIEAVVPANVADLRLELNLYPEEWGFVFRRGTRVSWIRVTDIPFIHGLDDDRLFEGTESLDRVPDLLSNLERRFQFEFHRARATVRTNLMSAESAVRAWLRL